MKLETVKNYSESNIENHHAFSINAKPTYVQKLDTSEIPNGDYCYEPLSVDANGKMKIKKCPYHSIYNSHEHQNNGFCNYLNAGDWFENGTLDLWDMLKNCNINIEEKS